LNGGCAGLGGIWGCKAWELPTKINTDQGPSYGAAIVQLKEEGRCPPELVHRQVQCLNNAIKADHGKLKRLIKPTLGFKTLKTAYATIKGFEVMRGLKKTARPLLSDTRRYPGRGALGGKSFLSGG